MAPLSQLQKQLVDYSGSLFTEGYLDDQFIQLQQLQDESNPDFVFEVVTIFFEDSEKLVNNMTRALEQQFVNYGQVDSHVHQLKGSSSSVGAVRVKNACIAFRTYCEQCNLEGCMRCLQQVRYENSVLKNKLDTLFMMERQILASGGSIPPLML